jgi:hypothetical protein
MCPELARLSVAFARGEDRLDLSPDPSSAAPIDWLRHYRDLFWAAQGSCDAAARTDEGPCRQVERGDYRLQVVATAPRATQLVARRAAQVARALEELLLLEEEERPDVLLPVDRGAEQIDAPPYRRVEVRLVQAICARSSNAP